MKNINSIGRKMLKTATVLIFSVAMIPFSVWSQEDEPEMHKARIKTSFLKSSEGNRQIDAALYARIDRKLVYLPGQELTLFVTGDTIQEQIGQAVTDGDGKVSFFIPVNVMDYADSSGYVGYLVEFEGADTLKAADSDLMVMDAELELDLEMDEDSIKTVTVRALSPEVGEESDPYEYITMKLYVKRLFGNLKIGEEEFAGGEATFEFPDDIPGGTTGMITVLARMEDTDEFGTVQVSEESDWGQIIVPEQSKPSHTSTFFRILAIVVLFILPAIILSRYILMYLRRGRVSA